jgi:acyl-CoA synthetase (AMP-forming)/AMP-acid ligase II
MPESTLLHELVRAAAARAPAAAALTDGSTTIAYQGLEDQVVRCAAGLRRLQLQRCERVGIYLEKRVATVVASFAAPAAGGVFVPLNPLLKAEQAAFILRDCDVRVLLTSADRLMLLASELVHCPALRHVVLVDGAVSAPSLPRSPATASSTPTWPRSFTPAAPPANPRGWC